VAFLFEVKDDRRTVDMASGGHNLKSNAAKKAHGTYRKDRDHTAKKPVAPAQQQAPFTLRCPAWIDRPAQLEWKRVVREIGKRLSNEDAAVLESYAVAYSQWKQYAQKLACEGPVVVVKGIPRANPLIRIVNEIQRTMLATAKHLGIDAGYRNKSVMSPEEALSTLSDEELTEKHAIAREREGLADEEDDEKETT
jgi:P27 family predicted phage terminase small subunit